MPKISVIMPVYNTASYLREAVESILNQTFTDFEFLIFNDASTDESLKILEEYAAKDLRIQLIDSPENKGYVYHLNQGIQLSKGEYIARMDSDDISLPQRFEKQISFLEEKPNIGMCGAWYIIEGSSKHGYLIKLPASLEGINLLMLHGNAFSHPSIMIRKAILLRHNLRYDARLMPAEDYALWVNLLDHCDLANIPEVLIKYRLHDQNISKKKRPSAQINHRENFQIKHIKRVFLYNHLSEDECALLQKFFSKRLDKSAEEIDRLILLLQRIMVNTRFNGVAREKMLIFLKEHFFYFCTTSTHLGLSIWFKYIKSKITHKSWKYNFKFFVKSLIAYQPKMLNKSSK